MMIEQQLLSKLTLVIPTYKRQKYALRNMRYWSGKSARMLVLDGSTEPISAEDLIGLSENVQYIHYPSSMVDRLRKSLNLVNSEYTALMGDDEFFLPSALAASIQALESETDLVACMGQALGFGILNPPEVNGFGVYPKHAGYEIASNSPQKRMYEHMSNYACSTIYSVVRTDSWKSAFAIYLGREFPVYAIGELQFELAISYFGKSKIIPVLHWLRSDETGSVVEEKKEDNPSLNRNNLFHEWWFSAEKAEFRNEFLKVTSLALASVDGRDVEVVSKEIEEAMSAYANLCLIQSKKTYFEELRGWLKLYIPTGIIKVIRNFLYVFRILIGKSNPVSKSNIPLMALAQQIAAQGVKVNFDELSEIVDVIKNFHTNDRPVKTH